MTAPTPQDGEAPDLELTVRDWLRTHVSQYRDFALHEDAADGLLAAVAPDIAAVAVRQALAPLVDGSGREGPADADDPAALLAREVRRQCAEQVRAVATSIEAGNLYDEPLPAAVAKELRTLAASWDEEQG